MADKNIKIEIEAVDKFSGNIEKLKKAVESLGDIKLGQKAIDNYGNQLKNVENMIKDLGKSKNIAGDLKKANDEIERLIKNYSSLVDAVEKADAKIANEKLGKKLVTAKTQQEKEARAEAVKKAKKEKKGEKEYIDYGASKYRDGAARSIDPSLAASKMSSIYNGETDGNGKKPTNKEKVELVDAQIKFDWKSINKELKKIQKEAKKNPLKFQVTVEPENKEKDVQRQVQQSVKKEPLVTESIKASADKPSVKKATEEIQKDVATKPAKVTIEAVDNFSKTINKLNKELAELKNKQSKIDATRISDINKDMDKLNQRMDGLYDGKIAKMSGDTLKNEVTSMIRQVNDLINKVDTALKNVMGKAINKGTHLSTANQDFIEFNGADVAKDMKKYRNLIAKALGDVKQEVKVDGDKKSFEDTKNKLKNEFKDNKVTQKVTTEEETKSKNTTKEKVKPTETKTKQETVAKETPKKEKESKETTSKVEAPKAVEQTVKTDVKAEVDKSSVTKAVNEIQKELSFKPVKIPIEAIDNFSKLVSTGRQKKNEEPKEELTGISALFKSWDSLVDKAKSEREHRGGKPIDEKLQSEEVVEKQEMPKKSKKKQKETETSSVEGVQEPSKKAQDKQKEESLTQKVELEVDKESIKKVQREAQQELDKKSLKVSVVPDKADFASEYEKVAKRIQKYNKLHPNEEFDITKARKKVNNFRGGNETDKELKHEFQIDNFIKKLATQGKKLEDVLPLERIQRLFAATKKNRQEIAEAKKDEVKKPKETVTEVIEPVVDNRAVNKIKKDVQKELNAPPVEMEVKVEEKKPKKEKKETATPEEKVSKITVDEKLTKGVQQIPIDGILKKLIVDKGATDTVIKAISSLTGNISNIKIDKTALSKSLSTTIRELNKTPFDIKVGKDEKYFTKVIEDNIKKASNQIVTFKVGLDKESLDKLNEKAITLKALIKPLVIDKEALGKLQEKDIKLSGTVKATKSDNSAKQVDDKIADEMKKKHATLVQLRSDALYDLDKYWQDSGGKVSGKPWDDRLLKFFNANDALAQFHREVGIANYDKIIKDLEQRLTIVDEKKPYGAAIRSALEVLQASQPQYVQKASKEEKALKNSMSLEDLQKQVAKGTDPEKFAKDLQAYRIATGSISPNFYSNMAETLGITEKHPFFDKVFDLHTQAKEAHAIWNKPRIEQKNEPTEEYKSLKKRVDDAAKEMEKAWSKAGGNENNIGFTKARKKYLEAQDDLIKFQGDSGIKSLNSIIKDLESRISNFGENSKTRQILQGRLDAVRDKRAKSPEGQALAAAEEQKKAASELRAAIKELRAFARGGGQVDVKEVNPLLKAIKDAVNIKNPTTENIEKFMQNLQKYRDMTGDISSTFYRKMGESLKIDANHPFYKSMQDALRKDVDAHAAWLRVDGQKSTVKQEPQKEEKWDKKAARQELQNIVNEPASMGNLKRLLKGLKDFRENADDTSRNFYKTMANKLGIDEKNPYYNALSRLYNRDVEKDSNWGKTKKATKEVAPVSNVDEEKFKTLMQKRNRAVVDMDKAYQDYGKDSDAFKKAQDRYREAQQRLQDFQLSAGVGGNISSVINDLKRQYAAYANNKPVQDTIREELVKAQTRKNQIDEELRLTDPKEVQKDFIKSLKDLADAIKKQQKAHEKAARELDAASRKAAQALISGKKAEQSVREADTFGSLQQLANMAKTKPLDTKQLDEFKKLLEDYRRLTDNTSSNYATKMRRDLGIDDKNSLFNVMAQMQQQANEIEKKWRQASNGVVGSTKPDSAQTMKNAMGIRKQYQTLAAEAQKYAQEAEKAWRNAGNKPSAEFEKFAQKYAQQMEKIMSFGQDLGSRGIGSDITVLSNLLRSMDKSLPIYDKTLQRIRELREEQERLKKATETTTQKARNAARQAVADLELDRADRRANLFGNLQAISVFEKDIGKLNEFKQLLEEYRQATNNISPNFYTQMRRQLGIGKDNPYYEVLKQLHLQVKEAERDWNQSEKNKEQSTKQSAQNIKNQYQSLAQKAKEVATEAEKAWRMHGGKPSPEFEELKNQFQEAMKNLVNFRKSLGNLSAGAEANIFSNMARSLGKSSPLYDEMIQKVKKLKQEQKELNDITKDQKAPKGSGRLGSIGGFLTGITQFFGRSSKGFGSFLEAVARVQSNMVKFGGSLAVIGVIMAGITAGMSGVVTGLNLVASTAQTLGNILMQIGQTIFQALRPGIQLYEQQQHAIFSFTAAIKSSGIVSNEQNPLNGQRLTDLGGRGTEIARGLSRQLIDRATLDAELSAFSLEELLRSLQGTLPLLLGRGMSLEQAYEVNKGVAGVAKMTQLSPNQILQETRDLAQGSITTRTSQVANALGITNADIAKYKGNADELFKYLMGKFKEYGELLSEFEDTAVGRWQQLLERYQMTTKTIVDGLAPMFKGVFEEIIAWTGTYRDKNGNYLDAIAGQWKKSNGEIIGTIKEVREAENHLGVDMPSVKFHLSDEMQDVKSALQEIIHYIAQSIDGVIQWAKETTGITDPIEVAKEGIKFLIDGFLTCVRILGEIFGWLYKNRESMFSIVQTTAKFILGLHLVISAVMFIVSAFKLVLGAIVALFKPLAKLQQMVKNPTEIIVRLVKGDFKGAGDLIASVFDGYGDSIKNDLMYGVNEFLGDAKNTTDAFNALMSVDDGSSLDQILDKLKIPKVQGKATTAVTKYSESGERNKHQGKTEGIQATDVRGEPKADDKEAAKAAKQALKEAQKALKEAIEKLKQELKDKLDELKEAQEVDDIAYKEGFMSMKDYYTEKARREQEEAQLRLAEAQAEKELISQTPFENEYDKLKELHKVSREIREYERAVAKTTRALGEVEHQIGKYTKSMQVMQQLQRQPIQTMMSGGQQAGAASFGALMSDNPQTLEDKMAWAMKAAMQAGFDKESAAAMVGNWVVESGGNLNPNAVGDNGTSYGIAQWHNERWDELIRWAKENASDPSDFRTQVMFALHEILKGRERGNFVSNNGDLRTQTWNYAKNVERPATWALNQSFSSRYGNAQKAYELAGKSISQVATSLGVTVNDVNKELVQLGQVIETLVSSTGELLGYKAPQQYSRSGIDTRYSRFQSMSGGVDTQISGLKPQVIQAINLVAKEFFEKTGEQIEWTSFTGSNLHQKGEWGHYAGWKADANIDPKYYEILKQILGKLGVGAGVEDFGGANQHVDISFAKGGVGGDVLTTPTGTEFYNKLSNAITANGVNVNLHEEQVKNLISDEFKKELAEVLDVDKDEKQRATFESMFRESANTTKLGHEVNEEALDRLQKLYELREKNTSRVSGNTLESNMLLMIKYTRQMMAARSDPEMLGELKLGFQLEKLDLAAEKISKFLDTNLEDVENKLKLDISKLQLGEIDATAITEYITKQLTDTSDPLGLAKGIEDLEKTYAEYISRGMREDAQRIKSKIQSIRDSMVSYFDKLRETVLQPWEMSEKIFNATPKYTSTQREFAEREFTAYKAEAELSIVNAHIASNNERLEETRQKIKDVEESLNGLNNAHADEIANIKESQAGLNLELENEKALYDKLQAQLEKYSDTTTDVVQKETELKALQDKQKAIESQQKLNLQQKEYLELLKQQPNYLNDVANAANEALDKGLNELLTDGVNNAKSLGEAFRNLAVGILKEIQRVSAKWLVKGFMNKFVGQFHVDEKGNSQMGVQATTQALVTTNQQLNATGQMLLQALGVNVGATPMQTTTPVFKSTEGLLDVNNPFANPWEQSTLNPNAQVPQQQPFTFDTGINLVDKSVERFGTALDKTSSMQLPAFDDGMNNVTKALTSGNSIDTTMQQVSAKTSTVFETVFAQFQTAGEQLVQAVQSVATRLQSVMFPGGAPGAYTGGFVKNNKILKLARGGAVYHNSGLVTGYGTSTSDDIPAMLSNGEAVLNAKAVKRLGLNFISAVNNGEFSKIRASVPHFASGGIVGEAQQSTARGMTDFAKGVGTEVSTNNNVNIALVRDENEAMETFMKSPQGERIMANFQKKSARIFYRS